MKVKKILKKKSTIITAATVIVLAGAGASYAFVNTNNPVLNAVNEPETEQVESPSPSPNVSPEVTIEPTASTTPTPSVTPTPKTVDSLTVEQIEAATMQSAECMNGASYKAADYTDENWEKLIRTEIEKQNGHTVYANGYSGSSHYGHKVCIYWYTKRDLTAN